MVTTWDEIGWSPEERRRRKSRIKFSSRVGPFIGEKSREAYVHVDRTD